MSQHAYPLASYHGCILPPLHACTCVHALSLHVHVLVYCPHKHQHRITALVVHVELPGECKTPVPIARGCKLSRSTYLVRNQESLRSPPLTVHAQHLCSHCRIAAKFTQRGTSILLTRQMRTCAYAMIDQATCMHNYPTIVRTLVMLTSLPLLANCWSPSNSRHSRSSSTLTARELQSSRKPMIAGGSTIAPWVLM